MRSWAESHDLGTERHPSIIVIVSLVVESNVDRHSVVPSLLPLCGCASKRPGSKEVFMDAVTHAVQLGLQAV